MILGEEDHTPDGRWHLVSYVGPYFVSTVDLVIPVTDELREFAKRLGGILDRHLPGGGYEALLQMNGGRYETMVFDERQGHEALKTVRTADQEVARLIHAEAVAEVALYAMLTGDLWKRPCPPGWS